MTHFYVTFPSNSSSKFYPGNTLSNFTTRLHSSISLSGDWEVALAEIIFPKSWMNVPRGAKFTIDCEECPSSEVRSISDSGINAFYVAKSYSIELEVPCGYYETMSEVTDAMNAEISQRYSPPDMKTVRGPRFVTKYRNQHVYATLQENMSISISPILAVILGVEDEQNPLHLPEEFESSTIMCNRMSDVNGGTHSLYIYCDILEHIPVGDTKAPLLRIVDCKGLGNEIQHKSFENLRYMPLQKKNFDSVEIDIRNSFGDRIAFESGHLVVTLHFRRANNPYFL
jgi:hypothetical protein